MWLSKLWNISYFQAYRIIFPYTPHYENARNIFAWFSIYKHYSHELHSQKSGRSVRYQRGSNSLYSKCWLFKRKKSEKAYRKSNFHECNLKLSLSSWPQQNLLLKVFKTTWDLIFIFRRLSVSIMPVGHDTL